MNVTTKLLEGLEAAWNRADGRAYGEAFADDADFVDIRGLLHHGKPAITAGHQAIFDSVYAGSRITYRALDARELAPNVIVAHGSATMQTRNGMMDGRVAMNTIIIVRRGDAFRIGAFHNALVEASPPPKT